MQRTSVLYLVTALLTLSVLEGGFYGISFFIPKRWCYKPPTREVFLHYLAGEVDWEVGWIPPPDALAAAGYRLSPAGAELKRPCIALYGDSFTFGSEVAPEFAWGNVL